MGSNGDQYIEEHWSQPVANQLIGMFRMVQEDTPVFYEFMTMGIEDHLMTLSIKHFNPGFDRLGREESGYCIRSGSTQIPGVGFPQTAGGGFELDGLSANGFPVGGLLRRCGRNG